MDIGYEESLPDLPFVHLGMEAFEDILSTDEDILPTDEDILQAEDILRADDELPYHENEDLRPVLDELVSSTPTHLVDSLLQSMLDEHQNARRGLHQFRLKWDDAPDIGGHDAYAEGIEASTMEDLMEQYEQYDRAKESMELSNSESLPASVATSVISAEPAAQCSSGNSGVESQPVCKMPSTVPSTQAAQYSSGNSGVESQPVCKMPSTVPSTQAAQYSSGNSGVESQPVCNMPSTVPSTQAASKPPRQLSDVVSRIMQKNPPPRNKAILIPLDTEKGQKAAGNPGKPEERQQAQEKAMQQLINAAPEIEPELPATGAEHPAALAESRTIVSNQQQGLKRSKCKTKRTYVPHPSPEKRIMGGYSKKKQKKKAGTVHLRGNPSPMVSLLRTPPTIAINPTRRSDGTDTAPDGATKTKAVPMGIPSGMSQAAVNGINVVPVQRKLPEAGLIVVPKNNTSGAVGKSIIGIQQYAGSSQTRVIFSLAAQQDADSSQPISVMIPIIKMTTAMETGAQSLTRSGSSVQSSNEVHHLLQERTRVQTNRVPRSLLNNTTIVKTSSGVRPLLQNRAAAQSSNGGVRVLLEDGTHFQIGTHIQANTRAHIQANTGARRQANTVAHIQANTGAHIQANTGVCIQANTGAHSQVNVGARSLLLNRTVLTNSIPVKIVKPATLARKPHMKTIATANQPQSSSVDSVMKLSVSGVLQPATSTNKYHFTPSVPSDMDVKTEVPVVLDTSSSPTQNDDVDPIKVGPCTTPPKTAHRGVKHKENRDSHHSPEHTFQAKAPGTQPKRNQEVPKHKGLAKGGSASNPFLGSGPKMMTVVATEYGSKIQEFSDDVQNSDELLMENHAHDDERGCVSSVVSGNVPLTTSVMSPQPTPSTTSTSFSCASPVTVSEQKNCPGVPYTSHTALTGSAGNKALCQVLQDKLKSDSSPLVGKRVRHHSETQSEFTEALGEPEVKRSRVHHKEEWEEWNNVACEFYSRPLTNVNSQSEIEQRNPFDHTTKAVRSSLNGNTMKHDTTSAQRKKGSGQPVTTSFETEGGYISKIPNYIGTSSPSVQIESGRKDLKAEDCVQGILLDSLPLDKPNPEIGMPAFSKIPSYATNPANSTIFDTNGDSLAPAYESRPLSRDRSRPRDGYRDSASSRPRSRLRHSEDDDYREHQRSTNRMSFGTKRNDFDSRERSTVYVGGIPGHFKDVHLRSLFKQFGRITKTQVFIREHMDNYGFVYFVYATDAANAIEKGTKDPNIPYELCYGQRRQFCESSYADLDGNKACEEEYNAQPRRDLQFDELLRKSLSTLPAS